jgi:acetolactate synthase-1/2/3 large subunit
MLGMHASPWANLALHESDALIAVGARFDDRATGKVAAFCPDASVVHIDIDPGQIHRIKTAHVGIIGDAAKALADLEPFIEKKTRVSWMARICALRRLHAAPEAKPGSPRSVIRTAAALAGDEAIIVTDVGQNQMWTARHYPFARPNRFLTSGAWAPWASGCPRPSGRAGRAENPGGAFLRRRRPAHEHPGDGHGRRGRGRGDPGPFRQRRPGAGAPAAGLFMGGRRFATDYRTRVDFPAVARGFGWRVFDLQKGGDPAEILARAMGLRGPCLVRVPVDASAKVYPMVPPGEANTRMIGATLPAPETQAEEEAV